MLAELHIRGLGVIEDAVLPLGPGLTVVTGETGAGKTMVVTGLLLLFGARADPARVRAGSEQASVDGRIEVDPAGPAAVRIRDAGGELDDGTALLRRVVGAAGRSRAYAGGAPVPVGALADVGEHLVAVHGQSDQLRLTRAAEQRATLDRYAGLDLSEYAAAFGRWRHAEQRLADRVARARELRREADLLAHGLAEIEAAAPQPGEDAELAALARRLADADALRLAARAAHDALLGNADDPLGDAADVVSLTGTARRALHQQAGSDPELDVLAERLLDIGALAAELGADLAAYADALDADPQRLAEVEGRRAVLAGLARKYGEDVGAVLAWADGARARLADLDVSDEALARLRQERDAAARAAGGLATGLRARRLAAADRLAGAVTAELAGLAMASAELLVTVTPRAASSGSAVLDVGGAPSGATADGADDVEFLLRPHAELPPLPVARAASGGELSRIMLALEVCLAGADPVPTLIFDEVDAGVGGRAALELGARLSRLAADHQVLVVTHLAQVAAFADRHLVVDRADGGVTRSDVRVVSDTEQVDELARMLAGAVSATARRHARELLAGARRATRVRSA